MTSPPHVERDRYADLLRAFAVVMVAVGHWVLGLLVLHGSGGLTARFPVLLVTWLWQVMPLLFFVGGFVHARALRHRPGYAVSCARGWRGCCRPCWRSSR